MQKRNWFVTGISRGFGKILAQEILERGGRVVGTTRDGKCELAHENLRVLALDVTDKPAVNRVVPAAAQHLGRLDVVVNNAGFGIVGAVEEVSEEEARRVMETNFFGTWNVLQAALPILRQQKPGHIVNFSSQGGITGIPGFGLYNAAKFAVEGLSEALAGEVKDLGIGVTILEPGSFRTDFLSEHSLIRAAKVIDAYGVSSGKTRNYADDKNGSQPGDPVKAMRALIQAVESENPPLRLALGADCLQRIRTKIEQVQKDVAAWEKVSSQTAYDQGS